MKVAVLASGSSGNLSLLETKQHKILMDAGLSGRKTKSLLAAVGVRIEDVDLAFLSHDHTDHSGGLGVLLRRYPGLSAFANAATWQYLLETNKIGRLPVQQLNTIEPGQVKTIDDLTVRAFATSHDAASPQYYVFQSGGQRMAFLTDTGYVSQAVERVIRDCDAYLLEFNYDTDMLRHGPYSWPLKQRILSDVGHLSNQAAGEVLADVVTKRTKRVFLAHRSQHNNTAQLARQAARQCLAAANAAPDLQLVDTYPDQPTPLIEI